MKTFAALLLTFSQGTLACTCWTPPGDENAPSFLVTVVDGDAIHPASDVDRKKWREQKKMQTRVKVVDSLNSGLKKESIQIITQSIGMCSEFFFFGATYRVESKSTDNVISGSTCNILLMNTDNVSKEIDPELLDAAKELSELEQKVKQLE